MLICPWGLLRVGVHYGRGRAEMASNGDVRLMASWPGLPSPRSGCEQVYVPKSHIFAPSPLMGDEERWAEGLSSNTLVSGLH